LNRLSSQDSLELWLEEQQALNNQEINETTEFIPENHQTIDDNPNVLDGNPDVFDVNADVFDVKQDVFDVKQTYVVIPPTDDEYVINSAIETTVLKDEECNEVYKVIDVYGSPTATTASNLPKVIDVYGSPTATTASNLPTQDVNAIMQNDVYTNIQSSTTVTNNFNENIETHENETSKNDQYEAYVSNENGRIEKQLQLDVVSSTNKKTLLNKSLESQSTVSSLVEEFPQSFTVSNNAVLDFLMGDEQVGTSSSSDMSKFQDLIKFPKFRFPVERNKRLKAQYRKEEKLKTKLFKKYGDISPKVVLKPIPPKYRHLCKQKNLIGYSSNIMKNKKVTLKTKSANLSSNYPKLSGKVVLLTVGDCTRKRPSLRSIPRRNYSKMISGETSQDEENDAISVLSSSSDYTPYKSSHVEMTSSDGVSSPNVKAPRRRKGISTKDEDIPDFVKCASCFGLIEGILFDDHKKKCFNRSPPKTIRPKSPKNIFTQFNLNSDDQYNNNSTMVANEIFTCHPCNMSFRKQKVLADHIKNVHVDSENNTLIDHSIEVI